MRKLIILSLEEPANIPAPVGPVWHTTALRPFQPFLHPSMHPQSVFVTQKMSTLFCFENGTRKYWSHIFYCGEIQKWSDM